MLLVFSLGTAQADSIAGRMVDRDSGNPMANFAFKINGQPTVCDALGWYAVENLTTPLKEIYLNMAGREVLLLTRKSLLHWQMGSTMQIRNEAQGSFDLFLTLNDHGQAVSTAQVTVVALDAQGRQNFYVSQSLEEFYKGSMRLKNIRYLGQVYLIIERAQQKWIRRLQPVAGSVLAMQLDWKDYAFAPSTAVALADTRVRPPVVLPYAWNDTAQIFYEAPLAPWFRRVYKQGVAEGVGSVLPPDDFEIGGLTQGGSRFSGKLSGYFNFWELQFVSNQKTLTVYSDEADLQVDVSRYGNGYELKSVKTYILDMDNRFDPAMLQQSPWQFVLNGK